MFSASPKTAPSAKLHFLVFTLLVCSLSLVSPECLAQSIAEPAQEERTLQFVYTLELKDLPIGKGPLDVFIPLAQSDNHQKVITREIEASIPGETRKEKVYGNEFWHGHLDQTGHGKLSVKVRYLIKRKAFTQDILPELDKARLSKEELEDERLFLEANSRVPISGKLIEKVQRDLPETANFPLPRARAIYDYVVETMDYKKVGKGWGNGDTHWACSKKYGNCTDFHALFISLARAEKIPAKFEIGFPLPRDVSEGTIPGYHCWVSFKLPQVAWTPIDASEAKKHPEKKELLFGAQPADRIKFTEGRDLVLGKGHSTKPLNYFVYPHVELGGKVYKKGSTEFSFKDVSKAEL